MTKWITTAIVSLWAFTSPVFAQNTAISVTPTSGTTASLLPEIAGRYLTAYDIGLLGDGVTDNSAAINAAFSSNTFFTQSGGGTLYFPCGTYIWKAAVGPAQPLTIRGAGRDCVTLELANSADTYLFAPYSYANNVANTSAPVTLENVTLNCNGSNQSGTVPCWVVHGTASQIRDNVVENAIANGIEIDAASADGTCAATFKQDNQIHDNIIKNNGGSGVYGRDSSCNDLSDVWVDHNLFNGNGGTTPTWQIYFERSAGVAVRSNKMFGNTGYGNVNLQDCASCIVNNNLFDSSNEVANGAAAVQDVVISTGSFGGMTVTGNFFKNNMAALPGSATGMDMLTLQNSDGNVAISCGGNSFNSVTLSGVVPVTYYGSYATSDPAECLGNGYSSNSPSSLLSGNIAIGGPSYQVISFSTNTSQAAATTSYYPCMGWVNNAALNESGVVQSWAATGFFESLYSNPGAPGAGQTYTVTLDIASSPSTLTCTISGTASTCSDGTHTPSISAHNGCDFSVTTSSGAAAAKMNATAIFVDPL